MSIRATKTNLNKIIRWSSSRYNEKKKSEVVLEILFLIEVGADTEVQYGTGSYCESGHLGGWDYILKIQNGVVTLTETGGKTVVYNLEKPKKNRYYTGAKRIKLVEPKFHWHKQVLEKEFEVAHEEYDCFYIRVTEDGRNSNMALDKACVEIVN